MQEYSRKRDFTRTPEPPPEKRSGKGGLIFVVHKHAARRLHYDLRLEIDGVLKSWALPHGPSLDPSIKRLAVMVEDHPLDYAGFEGVIPVGQYGAGQVIVWDRGTYAPVKGGEPFTGSREDAQEILNAGLAKGKVIVFFNGQKLQGEFTLVKMQRGENNWLFLKHKDNYVDTARDVLDEAASVVSGATIADLKSGNPRPETSQSPFPTSISPMLATPAKAPFSSYEWVFEPKLDGYRILAFVKDGKVTLRSRRGLDVTTQYTTVAEGLYGQPAKQFVLDGEIIALDKKGQACFQCLQNYLKALQAAKARQRPVTVPLVYYVFDLLYLNGNDLKLVPYQERKKLLQQVLLTSDTIKMVEHFSGDGGIIYKAALENGLEGVIAKRLDSIYEPGRRSPNWLKIKGTLSDEFVVGGYSRGTGNRSGTFGALLLGQYDKDHHLVYAGHVGTGFDEDLLNKLMKKLTPLQSDTCPFREKPPLHASTSWVRPQLVAEVKFSQRTDEGLLRAPVFLRLRDDKPPDEVGMPDTKESKKPGTESSKQKISGYQFSGSTQNVAGKDRNPNVEVRNRPQITDDNPDGPSGPSGILRQLENPAQKLDLTVEGQLVAVNNLEKELWPAGEERRALTKRDLLVYLTRISPYLLPHLKNRLITLSRYPDGIYGEQFYQKHWGHPLPDFVARFPITTEHEGTWEYIVCNNLATLLWLGQVTDIELHTWFSRVSLRPDPPTNAANTPTEIAGYPDFIVFDLDPYLYSGKEKGGAEPELNHRAFEAVSEVALWFKGVLDNLSLASFLKTSGKTGLHIYVPIKRQLDFDKARSVARTICFYVNRKHLRETTVEWAVEKRTGKIFLDFNQNITGKTLASVYSPRPTPEASVSMPIGFSELGKTYPTDFTVLNTPGRLQKTGDLWAKIMDSKRDLKGIINL